MAALFLALFAAPAFAAEAGEYRQFLGLDSRRLIWFLAQMHLFFGAFTLGVPLFAVIIEIIGWRNKEEKFDLLAYEFTSLLSVAYATAAALGGLLTFALITLYPTFMSFMAAAFKDVLFMYSFLFFGETACLYIYYYGWNALRGDEPFDAKLVKALTAMGIAALIAGVTFFLGLWGPAMRGDTRTFITVMYFLPFGAGLMMIRGKKTFHIFIGVLLNIFGTAIMQFANSMAGFMMSPVGVSESGEITGSSWQIFENTLATPMAIHRILGNLAFGGLVAGSYAAFKFMAGKTAEEKAYYDWMGYISNFVALAAIIPLPFAGYYLGREIYSTSATMGNNMMGGDFSWTFIIQAMLVGSIFLISNYYLWVGMGRIPGAERYYKYIKYLLGFIVISFAIWLTPHNLPLSGAEVSQMGGSQYHPTLKYLGLMPAKNAVVNFIILSTFVSFLLYRRGNKGERVPVSSQGRTAKIAIVIGGLIAVGLVGNYAVYLFRLDPAALDLPPDSVHYFRTVGALLVFECVMGAVAVILALKDKGIIGQTLYLASTAFNVTLFLGPYGFVVMEKASPFLRNVAVSQFTQLISCIILVTTIDIFLFKGAKEIGGINWGKMSARSQYALLLLTIIITLNMGLMGFIRSGLRGDWHVLGVMRDTSPWSYTPNNFTMTYMVGLSVSVFLVAVSFMFWLGSLAPKKEKGAHSGSGSAEKSATAPER
jgi:cytochrome bd-type quinol oxidase subunit 1